MGVLCELRLIFARPGAMQRTRITEQTRELNNHFVFGFDYRVIVDYTGPQQVLASTNYKDLEG